MEYSIPRARVLPDVSAAWDSPSWAQVPPLALTHFRPESKSRHPQVEAKVQFDRETLYVLFRVRDQYVRSVITEYMGPVCTDSCVEFFVAPVAGKGYFNIEINAGGTLHISYVVDPTRTPKGFKEYTRLPPEDGAQIRIFHTLPAVVEPEIETPLEWRVGYAVPLALFEKYVGPIGNPAGQTWRGNFYKCADRTSHPHWVTWAPVDVLNFHLPQCFATLRFAG